MANRIGKERYTYQAAVEGNAPDPPAVLYRRTKYVPNRDTHLWIAMETLLGKRLGDPAFDDIPCAWHQLKDVAGSDDEHIDLMRMLIYLVEQDTRYWGVLDPESQRYCTVCREAKAVEAFSGDRYRCDGCRYDSGDFDKQEVA